MLWVMGWLKDMLIELFQEGPVVQGWEEREPGKGTLQRTWGLKTTWLGTTRLKWKKCRHCTGGQTTLYPGGWGKIPMAWRKEQDDETGSPLANLQKCLYCHGVGHRWMPEEE
jgi:hypothetical protein